MCATNLRLVSDETLQALHSIFGAVLVRATEILENHKVIVYRLNDDSRRLVKLTSRRELHVLFDDLNFCRCDSFRNGVLEGKIIACEHVLAAKLARIRGDFETIAVTDAQLKEMLDEELRRFAN